MHERIAVQPPKPLAPVTIKELGVLPRELPAEAYIAYSESSDMTVSTVLTLPSARASSFK